jgi:hypothetical protein
MSGCGSRKGDHRKAFIVPPLPLPLLNLKSIAFCEEKHIVMAQKKWAAAFERHLDVYCPVVLVFDLWVFNLWFWVDDDWL